MFILLVGGFMKYAVEMCTGGITYIPSFIKTGSAIRKLLVGQGDLIILALLFKISKIG
jgi:hypothetical protein